jgi:hypothetical protein
MYTLFNRELQRFLKHPTDGIWASDDYKEAQELLEAAKQYVKAIGVPEIADHLIVMEINADTVN